MAGLGAAPSPGRSGAGGGARPHDRRQHPSPRTCPGPGPHRARPCRRPPCVRAEGHRPGCRARPPRRLPRHPAAHCGEKGTEGAGAGGDFDTRRAKDRLVAVLPARAAALTRHHVAETLARAHRFADPDAIRTAAHWLAGDDEYEVREPGERRAAAAPQPPPSGAPPPSPGARPR
ncbi:hypothetical protein ACFQ0M_47805 [Kitasatospora aburaviensis]